MNGSSSVVEWVLKFGFGGLCAVVLYVIFEAVCHKRRK